LHRILSSYLSNLCPVYTAFHHFSQTFAFSSATGRTQRVLNTAVVCDQVGIQKFWIRILNQTFTEIWYGRWTKVHAAVQFHRSSFIELDQINIKVVSTSHVLTVYWTIKDPQKNSDRH